MGIENRDYMGANPPYRGGGPASWSAVTTLIVVTVCAFFLQVIFTPQFEIWGALGLQWILQGQIWRLTTYDFLHDTTSNLPFHLFFNMWLLYIAGRRVEEVLGKIEFLAFYLTAGILSGVTFLLWGILIGQNGVAIGASGASVAVMIVFAVYWPQTKWLVYGFLPVTAMVLAIISAVLDLLPMLGQLAGGEGGGIAHAAHIGGMLFGFLYARFGWRLTDWMSESSGRQRKRFHNPLRRRPHLKVHTEDLEENATEAPTAVSVEVRLDQLLEKIVEKGEASLTPAERQFLTETSQRYRNRRKGP